jgi:propanol-preferring alcohol dehydrogenase
MKAARLVDGVLEIQDVPVPEPGLEEALVRISASGICHSDLHLARGDWHGVPRTGGIGHEAIGTVEALGPGADRFVDVGDRVILGLGGMGGGYWCGACKYCLQGQPRHCAQTKPIIGTFAEYFSVWAPSLVAIPGSLSDHEAPLACGGLTAYGAVKKLLHHRVVPGSPVAVIGAAGGLGHYAVQLANAPLTRSKWCNKSLGASKPAWCSPPRWPGSDSASTCSRPADSSSPSASPRRAKATSSSTRSRCS